jgi:hypothetical protein
VAKLKNLIRGDAFSIIIPVRNADGTPFDFTGYKAFLTVKPSIDEEGEMTADDTDAVLQVEVSSITDPTDGEVIIPVTASDMEIPPGTYYYDVQFVPSSGEPWSLKYDEFVVNGGTVPQATTTLQGKVELATQAETEAKIDTDRAVTPSAVASPSTPSDAESNGSTTSVKAMDMGFNGSTWERRRSNEEATLLASGARTTTQTGADITNYNGIAALIVVLDVTSAGTGSITLTIEGKDSASDKYYTILSGVAVTTNSTNRYRVGPNLAAAANSVAQDYLPRVFRITVTANNANSVTYSVGYCLVRG